MMTHNKLCRCMSVDGNVGVRFAYPNLRIVKHSRKIAQNLYMALKLT
jgi:hypothetical protein